MAAYGELAGRLGTDEDGFLGLCRVDPTMRTSSRE